MSWIGGKKALRDKIINRFPLNYERYIEVFGGGGWVLFHKDPRNDLEVYNDFNNHLTNLFQCVRDKPAELIEKLAFVLNSRVDFMYVRQMLKTRVDLHDITKAAYFYQVIKQSYASALDSFGGHRGGMWSSFPTIYKACERLQKVIIENKDFESLIRQYDKKESFFYCDPPYYKTENYYSNSNFSSEDHQRLASVLMTIQGKFLLSYNDCPEIRNIYEKEGIYIEAIKRPNIIPQKYDEESLYKEVLISNYDTSERAKQTKQITLF